MNRDKSKRIRSLEISIEALRELNRSDSLRAQARVNNTMLIYQYMDEIAAVLLEEYQDSGKQFPPDHRIQ